MIEEARPRLGRGLAALIGDAAPESAIGDRPQRRVPIEHLRPNPRNPRKAFPEESLAELTDSIRAKGLIQPIVVRPIEGDGHFEIIAGERRWRAAQRAGLHEAPVVVVKASERDALELAIIENVQRSDLNPIEEARGYGQLMNEFQYTQQDLASIIGKSRSHLANTLRLLNLPHAVLAMVEAGELSSGHARALLAVADPEAVARRIVDQRLTVRDVEELGQRRADPSLSDEKGSAAAARDPNIRDLEKTLSDALGLKVDIKAKGESGEIRIRYRTIDQFDALCGRLK